MCIFKAITCFMDSCILHYILRVMIPKSFIFQIFASGRFFHSGSHLKRFYKDTKNLEVLILYPWSPLPTRTTKCLGAVVGNGRHRYCRHDRSSSTWLVHTRHTPVLGRRLNRWRITLSPITLERKHFSSFYKICFFYMRYITCTRP